MYLLSYTTETTSLAFGGWSNLDRKDSGVIQLERRQHSEVLVGIVRATDPME